VRWRALDLEIGTLVVRESVYEGKVQRPKTQKSKRTIPLGPHAIASLKAHRDRSTRKSADDLVFPNKSGEPLRESKLLERVLQPAADVVDASQRAAIESLEQRLFPTVPKSQKADTPSESLSTRKRAG